MRPGPPAGRHRRRGCWRPLAVPLGLLPLLFYLFFYSGVSSRARMAPIKCERHPRRGRRTQEGVRAIGGTDPAADAVASLLAELRPFCPPAGNGLPEGSVTLVELTDRPVLLDGPPTAQARVLRLAGLARFQLWFAAATTTDSGVNQLTASLLGQRQALRARGLLRLRHTGVGEPAEFTAGLWGRYVDVDVLYE